MAYLIKKTYVATDTNTNFKGETHTYYKGPKDRSCSDIGIMMMLGYLYKCKNKRILKREQEFADDEAKYGAWNITVEWIEV